MARLLNLTLLATTCLLLFCPPAMSDENLFDVLIPAPSPEAQRGLLYMDGQKRTIMEYDLGQMQDDKVYFTDGKPLFGIDDNEALALANTPRLLSRFAKEHGLSALSFHFDGLATQNDLSVGRYEFDGRSCEWPYAVGVKFKRKDSSVIKLMFFHRREFPKDDIYRFWCERGSGETVLLTNYENLVPSVLTDGSGAPLLAFQKPAVVLRVNEGGSIVPSQIKPGIIVVAADLSERLFSMAAEAELKPQEAIRRLEDELCKKSEPPNVRGRR
jgi:hypothetical protein